MAIPTVSYSRDTPAGYAGMIATTEPHSITSMVVGAASADIPFGRGVTDAAGVARVLLATSTASKENPMHKIETNRSGGFGLPNGLLVEAGRALEVEADTWKAMKDHPVIAGAIRDGSLIVDRKTGQIVAAAADELTELKDRIDELELENASQKASLAERDKTIAELKSANAADEKPPSLIEVLALASADGVQFLTFKAAAQKALGAGAPGKKDELAAALVAKLTDDELKAFLASKQVEVKDGGRAQLEELAKVA